MSTDHHTAIATGAAANAATFNAPLGQLDAVLGTLNDTVTNAVTGVCNVLDYGASSGGDAATNTTAINAAIAAATAVAGGTVVIPPGTYAISGTINMVSHITLRGQRSDGTGSGGTLLVPNAETFAAITVTGRQVFWRIENLAIAWGSAATTSTAIGIKFVQSGSDYPFSFEISGVDIFNSYRGVSTVGQLQACAFRNMWIQTANNTGVYLYPASGSSVGIMFENVYVQSSACGFFIVGCSNLHMTNCYTDQISANGVALNTWSSCTGFINGWWAEACTCGTGAAGAIMNFTDSRMTVQGVVLYANTINVGGGNSAVALKVASDTARNRIVFINPEVSGDTLTSGTYYIIAALGGLTQVFAPLLTLPLAGTSYYYYNISRLQIYGLAQVHGQFTNFGADDATPSVIAGNLFKTANANATTITMFDEGMEGQTIKVVIADAVTTVDFSGTNLKGNAGADWSPGSGDWLEATFDGTNWYCSVHDCTA